MASKENLPDSRGRLLYIDPNPEGQEFIDPEDLSILVELSTDRKSRSTISSGGNITSSGGDSGSVSFLEGSPTGSGGKRSLTTSYIEIGTTFSKPSDDSLEGFGMTDIDIQFNTSYAPLVKIKFVDIRGGALTRGNESKYGVFFELPYPIFRLKVKGYYGKTVLYCLHMTKWNAEFNTKTGNFEIEAEFIGYTYAMLTDILMGYLKAVPYTELGAQEFATLKAEFETTSSSGTTSPIITIDEMLASISTLNENIDKFKQSDPTYKKLLDINKANNIIGEIKQIIGRFFSQTQVSNAKILSGDGEKWTAVQNDDDNKTDSFVKSYTEEVDKKVDELKKVVKSTNIAKNKFHVITTGPMNRLDPMEDFKNNDKYETSGRKGGDITHTNNMAKDLKSGVPNDELKFKVYDLFKAATEINSILDKNRELEAQAKADLSVKLRDVAKTGGNFNPTIRNVFRILTVHCEVLMRTIQKVAKNAEDSGNTDRHEALTGLGRKNLNVPSNSTIYAFPEYDEGGEEKYLGNRVSSSDVDEIGLVEDFLSAFIKSKQTDLTADTLRLNSEVDWFALTPMDTKASQVGGVATNPYRIEMVKHPDELLRKLMFRTFMYMGNGNDSIDDELIQYMAKLEANNMYFGTRDLSVRDAMATNYDSGDAIKSNFISGSKNITNRDGLSEAIPYMTETGGTYTYQYISDGKRAYLPVNGDWDGQNFYDRGQLKSTTDLNSLGDNRLFIGNYINGNSDDVKVNDGAKYLKILDRSEYLNYKFNLPLDSIVDLKESYDEKYEPGTRAKQNDIENGLKADSPIKGINPLDTKFGVTEFFEVAAGGGAPIADLSSIKNDDDKSLVMPAFYVNNNYGDVDERTGTRIRETSEYLDIEAETNRESKLEELRVGETMSLINDGLLTGSTGLVVDKIEFGFMDKRGRQGELTTQSLFGSALYYAQEASREPELAKAFLFVNTFPLEGMKLDLFSDTTSDRTILGILATNSAFVSTPSLWTYWIGSLLWRDKYFTDNGIDPIITKVFHSFNIPSSGHLSPVPTVSTFPTTKEMWYATGIERFSSNQGPTMLLCGNGEGTATYRSIESTILNLPEQVKDEFISKFEAFSEVDFITIKDELEYFNTEVNMVNNDVAEMNEWFNMGSDLITDGCTGSDILGDIWISTSASTSGNRNYRRLNPQLFSFGEDLGCTEYSDGITPVWFDLDIVEDVPVNRRVVDLMLKRSVIMNYSPYTFRASDVSGSTAPITINQEKADTFLDLVAKEYKDIHEKYKTEVRDEQSIKNKIFQSSSNETIKLNIYRHLAALNNKWLGDNNDPDNIFFTCQISDPTTAQANANARIPRLIDTFFFLNKAYTDIGDDFLLNPKVLSDMITGNYNQSFFDYINRVLADNNFNFIPLPTFVNFKTVEGMNEIFEPYSYKDVAQNGANLSSGPSFVCVYVGQTSKHLDLGRDADYPDDGVDLSPRGISRKDTQFTLPPDGKTGGLSLPVFAVNYAQQNQNYFKDIKLDQKEFTETEEGLQIIDEISKSGDKNKSTYVGQNLFNVYQTRSYSAEVEALGMPLVQPMMYFQLNNIPMFRGAYLIINTSHSIKPNHMTTKFKGVRIRDVRPPKIESVFEISDLLGEIDGAESLEYSIDETIYSDSVKTSGDTLPDDKLTDSTRDYYNLGYQEGYRFDNKDFDLPSNTKRNGSYLTYTQIFQEVSDITKVPVNTLKAMSVIESAIGQVKGNTNQQTGIGNEINSSGFVGLMQFGRPATVQVKSEVEKSIFGLGLEFYAVVDETNKKLIIPPITSTEGNQWATGWQTNTKDVNSMFDDFISAMASAYLAINNIDVGDPSNLDNKTVLDVYLSHQQGETGYGKIRSNPIASLCDPDESDLTSVAKKMRGNPPIKELNTNGGLNCGTSDNKKIVFEQWVAAWEGKIDTVLEQIDPSHSVPNPNANNLRRVLAELGYTEKGTELDGGGDITKEMSVAAASVFRTISSELPNLKVRVTAGNDNYHQNFQNSNSRHKSGRAVDFTITPATSSNISEINTILQGYAVGNNAKFRFLDEYTNATANATGGHFHMSWGAGTEGQANLANAIALAQSSSGFQPYTV